MFNNISGTTGDDQINGTDGNDFIRGLAGADTINGGAGDDAIFGGAGVDRILGGAGDDLIYDRTGKDTITGGDGNDILFGGVVMNGDAGDDVLISNGAAPSVTMIGSAGSDTYFGSNASSETYSYVLFLDESTPENPDTIYNFQSGQDRFDFSGEQPSVVFVGDAAFSGRDDSVAEARFQNELLEIDVDGDQAADLAYRLVGVDSITAEDIVPTVIEPAELPRQEVFGAQVTGTFAASDDVEEVFRYNLFGGDSTADAPDVIQNFKPGQDSFFFSELGTRIDYIGADAFSGNPDPLLGIEARFADERLEIDENGDAVADQVIVLEGVQNLNFTDLGLPDMSVLA
jgi:Ca2+-binding RTX toxin-like protein